MLAVLCLAALGTSGCSSGRNGDVEPVTPQVRPSDSHYEAARAALTRGDTEEADLEVRLALRDNPLDARSHFLLGCLLEVRGEHDQAVAAFHRALTLDSTNPETLYNLGTLLMRRREVVVACDLFEKAVLIRPDHVPSWNNLGKTYYQLGLPELAIGAYEEVLRLDSSNAIAHTNLQLLAEAAGLEYTAAAYGLHLSTPRSDPFADVSVDEGNRTAALPARAVVAAGAVAPAPTSQPAARASEQGDRHDAEADNLRQLLRDLPHVKVERRGGRLVLTGWTRSKEERAVLDRVLGKAGKDVKESSQILDLTCDDTGDPDRLIEIDAVLFVLSGIEDQSVGFNFLEEINLNLNYFATDHHRDGTGYSGPPDVVGAVRGLSQYGWIFSASVDYVVNIANALDNRVAILARPHLTTVSGTPAKFLAGGELVYEVSGLNSGDIKPYSFGTNISVTPTLLRTPAEDGTPRVRLQVEAGRTSALALLDESREGPTAFEKVTVSSEAIIALGQTLILSGLNQRESRSGREGVPVLMDIPVLKYLFSRTTNVQADVTVMILLTPRDPAFLGERYQQETARFIEKRRAFLQARRGTPEDMQRFRERYPDWDQLPPNRFATHLLLLKNSELYRVVCGQELTAEDVDLELLGPSE